MFCSTSFSLIKSSVIALISWVPSISWNIPNTQWRQTNPQLGFGEAEEENQNH